MVVASAAEKELRAAAAATLRANDLGRYTVPSRTTYPHQWNWDSALIALGWGEIDPERAWIELQALVGARDQQGLVPHIAFRTRLPRPGERSLRRLANRVALPRARGYLPGPRWWGRRTGADGRRISAITQPPLAATCARLLFERHPDEQRARKLLWPLHAWHRFLLDTRDPEGRGEPALIHPWESGRDNAVEWDAPLWRVRPQVLVLRRRDTQSVDAAERPSNDHYRRFLTLVRQGTEAGWPQRELATSGPFRVLDPGFGGILARAGHDLAQLADALDEPELAEVSRSDSQRVGEALAARADSDGLIRALDLRADEQVLPETGAGSALAVLAPGLPARCVSAVRELVRAGPLASGYGVRSLDRADARRSERNYWRGPVWANITWLCAHGLDLYGEADTAAMLREQMLDAVAAGGMREYFAPEDGRGLGARDFAWTAALALRELS
jgi:mannosylglycerate hydrolase